MKGTRLLTAALAMLTGASGDLSAAVSVGEWAGHTFLSDSDQLQPVAGREERDCVYLREVGP